MTRKPTLAQRFAGFFALFALALVHGRLAWIVYNAMANDRPPESTLDLGLFVWGMLVLYALASVAGVVAVFVAWAAIRWVVWAIAGKEES
jgi:cation transporter-like permease